jgi:5-formyltetrahydrofolate cyclo-ligase
VALPVVTARGLPLGFRRWRPGDVLVSGAFGLLVPGPSAEPVMPQLVLVPLLAFDRQGGRLGYGAGFYDRTLAVLRAAGPVIAIGVAYADQEVPAVPVEPHDQPLDWIATEREILAVPGQR